MQRHDACGRGKGCKAWTPTACGGSTKMQYWQYSTLLHW